jgi:hypothetical protein
MNGMTVGQGTRGGNPGNRHVEANPMGVRACQQAGWNRTIVPMSQPSSEDYAQDAESEPVAEVKLTPEQMARARRAQVILYTVMVILVLSPFVAKWVLKL